MNTKHLFRRASKYASYIFVFFWAAFSANAQCPTITNPTPPPICDATGFTFNDLNAFATDLGSGIVWYDAPTGGIAFNSNELVLEGTYYADDSSGVCGTRGIITIDFEVDPTGQNLQGIFCSNENATIQTYIDLELTPNAPIGGSVEVYTDVTLTTLVNNTDPILSGGTNYFIVFEDNTGCRSQIEIGTTALFTAPVDPTPPPIQEFCSDTNPTVADLDPGTMEVFNWYSNIDTSGDGIPPSLSLTTPLVDGATYYIQVEDFPCISNAIPVLVNIFDPVDAGSPGNDEYCVGVLATNIDLFTLLGGTPDTNGTWTGPLPTSNGITGTITIDEFTPADVYVFTYTVAANGACPQATATVTITVYDTFTSGTVSALNPATFCEAGLPVDFDLTILLDNEDPNGQWTLGLTSTDPVVTSPIDLTAFTPGTYNFTYTQNVLPNPCLEESTTVQVVVLTDPDAGLAVNETLCENDLAANSPYDLFNTLDGSQDNNSGVWTDNNGTVLTNPIDITTFTVVDSPYQFTYTIDNGTCIDSENTTITVEDAPESGTPVASFPEFCEGAAPAAFDLFDLLDGEDQTGVWYSGTDNTGAAVTNPIDLSGFTPGTYDFTFDVNAIGTCDDPLVTVQVTINALPNTGTPTPVVLCENDLAANSPLDLFGQLVGNDLGGVWSDDDATGALTGSDVDLTLLTIGVYDFTYSITDANMCMNSSTVTITVEDAPESGTPVATFPEFCEGAAPAAFDLFDLLDGEDQTGTWFAGIDNTGAAVTNPIDLSGFTPGIYDFTFDVDAIGTCDDPLVTVQVTINALPNTGTPIPVVLCENDLAANSPLDLFGQLAGNDLGGVWSDDDATGALTGSDVDLTLLAIGVYDFTYSITDANMCMNSSTVIITIEDAPESGTPVATFPEFCEGAAPAAFDLFDLLDGEDQTGIWFAGTDNTGAAVTNPIDLSGFTPGTYDFTFDVDAIGTCDDPLVTVQVTINALPNTGTPTPVVLCENDLAANSPLDLLGQIAGNDLGGVWSDDDATGALTGSDVDLTVLTIGVYNFTYSLTVNGCTESSTVVITVEDAPEAGTVNDAPEFCLSEITTGQAINLFDYLDNEDQAGTWSDNTPSSQLAGSIVTIDGLAMGTYTFTYDVDAIGTCDDLDMPTVTVIINDTTVPTVATPQEFCDTATVADLSATGTAIQWYDDATGGTALDPSTALVDGQDYFATQTDATTGCESSIRTAVVVTIFQTPSAGNLSSTPISDCNNNNSIDLSTGLDGTQDAGGTWLDDDATGALTGLFLDATGLAAGTYNFTYLVTASAPCLDASTTITVTIDAPLNAGTNAVLDVCSDTNPVDLFTLIGSADAGGVWALNNTAVSNIFDPLTGEAGTYIYMISNACGNTSSEVVITLTQAPNAGTDNVVTLCVIDGSVDLFTQLGTADTNGTWLPALPSGTGVFDPASDTAGVYTYTVLAASPCTTDASAQITVTVNDTTIPVVTNATPSFCLLDEPTVADLNGFVSTSGTIIWYTDATQTTSLSASEDLIDGEDYFVTQTNASGCESSVSTVVTVTVNDTATPTLIDSNLELCINDEPTIAELTENITEYDSALNNVIWYDAATNGSQISSTALITNATTYYAVLVDPVTGCESSIRLEVNTNLTGCGVLAIPDGFSPNGDGVNDTFDIDNLNILFPNFELEIYNRYGNIVYKGNASTTRFNGKSNQSSIGSGDLPVGVYYYIFNYNDGVNNPKQGSLYLNR